MKVWDGFIRGFHGLLIIGILCLWFTGGKPEYVDLHQQIGVLMLSLVLTRFIWGFIGSENARFSYFISSPKATLNYIKNFKSETQKDLGVTHNPLGGWSVLLMLVIILSQGITGLFTDDGIFFRGPLAPWVSTDLAYTLTSIHHSLWSVLKILIILHISAIIAYRFLGKPLAMAMIHGKKAISPAPQVRLVSGWWGYLLLAVNAAWLTWLLG
ncbi:MULTISPECIES: cytochrome b/b6 domain-containing protein [Gammaproteobacteria]|uniref:cytochrome b/b6 domain-containing protein n=1 Tax=Gammaproteobacteria TaxID=1236 RepID=UPI001401D09C|nr:MULTISPECIES: cytochrome b/b6 domain-containing protein [Gammaproteobacteria]